LVDWPLDVLTGPGVVPRGVVLWLVDIDGLHILAGLLERGCLAVVFARDRQPHHEAASSPCRRTNYEVALHLPRELAGGVQPEP
jgi:hypothetical protein